MELSAEQERAKTAILNWYRSSDRKPFFYLAGRAGRGKTACITATTEHIKGLVMYVAPTARAALIMRQKGCDSPRTVHSLIYKPAGQTNNKEQIDLLRELKDIVDINSPRAQKIRNDLISQYRQEIPEIEKRQAAAKTKEEREKGEWRKGVLVKALATNLANYKDLVASNPVFDLNHDSDIRKADLVVVDEVSMCNRDMVEDLLSFGVPLLIQGDKGQLPPTDGESFVEHLKPDFELIQVHRQAKDSPIIYLADLAADGKPLPVGWHGNCLITKDPCLEEAMAADQIIVGKNDTRRGTNIRVRELRGFTGLLNIGERVICKHNDLKKQLYNNDQYQVTFFREGSRECRVGIKNEIVDTIVNAHKDYFVGKEPNPFMKSKAACLTYGYAITCHSSQGGTWRSVYVKDESRIFRGYSNRWLYTAMSRPSEKLVVHI